MDASENDVRQSCKCFVRDFGRSANLLNCRLLIAVPGPTEQIAPASLPSFWWHHARISFRMRSISQRHRVTMAGS
jgi:hypothetical protein